MFSDTPTNSSSAAPLQTLENLIRAYSSLSADKLCANFSDAFRYRMLPESLGSGEQNGAEFYQHAVTIFGVFETFEMKPCSLVLSVDGRSASMHATMSGTLRGMPPAEAGQGVWIHECILLIRLSESGTLIDRIDEFVDSAKAKEMGKMNESK